MLCLAVHMLWLGLPVILHLKIFAVPYKPLQGRLVTQPLVAAASGMPEPIHLVTQLPPCLASIS